MKNLLLQKLLLLIFLISPAVLVSCESEDCEPKDKPLLTEKEKGIISNQVGDTLYFKDNNGQKYFLVCKSKALSTVTYIPKGHENTPCKSIYETWDKLTAKFDGNITTDAGSLLFLETILEGGLDPYSLAYNRQCIGNYKCLFYLNFNVSNSNEKQVFWGQTQEDIFPIIINYNFKQDITLGGQQFFKVTTTSFTNDCTTIKNFYVGTGFTNFLGLDSIYYTAQEGLIRLTTVGGKKYQRVL